MDNYHYELECYVCDNITTVVVPHEEEKPLHCPMCGTEAGVTFLGDSDTYT